MRLLKLLLFVSLPTYVFADGITSTNYIQNTSSLQAGAIFYVSSGTVTNILTAQQVAISSNQVITHGTNLANMFVFQIPDAQSLWIGPQQNVQTIAGTFDTFIGANSGSQGAIGSFSTGIGNSALPSLLGGAEDSCFGYGSCGSLVNGSYNIGDGANSLAQCVNGSRNTAVGGVNSLYAVTGDDNIGIGYSAGYGDNGTGACNSGTKNMFFGQNTGFTSSTQLNQVNVFGYEAKASSSNVTQIGGQQGTGFESSLVTSTMTFYNHLNNYPNQKPVVSSCGITPAGSVVGGDAAGTISIGGGVVTACTLTFAVSYANTPTCVVSDNSTAVAAAISSISTTAVTFSFSATIGNGKTYYHCFGSDSN